MVKNAANSIQIPMRNLFHVPDNYFLSHSVGCLPIGAEKALGDQFFGPWISGENWTEWMQIVETFRGELAALLAVDIMTICPQMNISSALTKILYSLPKDEARKTILLSRQDFPTIGFVLEQAKRQGFNLRFVEGNPADIENWICALDSSVALVHVTHALSNTSHLLPVTEICALAKSQGAVSVIDIAQSIGAVPIDLMGWQADFAIGTGVKFLCAGPGACFLYAAANILPRCKPIDVGWFSHENPFEMDINHFKYAPDAMRFFGGTPSPAPLAIANHALKTWRTVDLKIAHKTIQDTLDILHEAIAPEMIVSPHERDKRGATFVASPKNRDTAHTALHKHGISYDERVEGFRFSVHGYTNKADVSNLIEALST